MLKFVREVDRKLIADAFTESLEPRLPKDDKIAKIAVEDFKKLMNDIKGECLPIGSEMLFVT
eukprot:UN12608